MYGLDLMGTDSCGGDGAWGGEQAWANQDYGNDQWGEYEGTGYLRSLATLDAVPIVSVKNSFDALADRHDRPVDVRIRHDRPIDVPIADLIVTSKRRIRNKTKNKQKFIDNRSSSLLFVIVMLLYMSIYSCRSGEVSFHPAEDGRRPETYRAHRQPGSRVRHVLKKTQGDHEL